MSVSFCSEFGGLEGEGAWEAILMVYRSYFQL